MTPGGRVSTVLAKHTLTEEVALVARNRNIQGEGGQLDPKGVRELFHQNTQKLRDREAVHMPR
jgi:hypothetical protein